METPGNTFLDCAVSIVVGALILCGALYYWRSGRDLRDHGVTTRATVVAKQRHRFGSVYTLEFTDPDGERLTVEIKMRSTGGNTTGQGSTVPVTYVPGRLETARWGLKWGVYIEGWLALLVAAGGGGMVLRSLYLLVGLLTGKAKSGGL